MRKFLGLVLLLGAGGCPPPPLPPPPDASDAAAPTLDAALSDSCATACINLRAINCPEADDPSGCMASCRAAAGRLIGTKTIACWASAKAQDSARACGSLRCTR